MRKEGEKRRKKTGPRFLFLTFFSFVRISIKIKMTTVSLSELELIDSIEFLIVCSTVHLK